MKPEPKVKPITLDDGDREAVLDFCREAVQANDEDYNDEGFFYADTPQFYSLGRPEKL